MAPGEIVGVVGESGSGKSVAANYAMGLLPNSAMVQCDSAHLFGKSLETYDSEAWQQVRGVRISMIFQDPMTALHPSMRIYHQLEEVLTTHSNLDKQARKARILQVVQEVELPDPQSSVYKYPHELSGGQRQRVVIAMAMLLDPKLILADEPTTALDKEVEQTVLDLLKSLVRKKGCAMWFISHDLEVVAELADRILVLYQGQTVEQGPAAQVFPRPKHAYTKGLLACRPPKEGRPYPLPTLESVMTNRPLFQEELLPPVTQEPVIELKGFSLGYTRKRGFRKVRTEVIQQLDLELFKGETLGLIGPSGSGKSSIGRAIVGLNTFSADTFKLNGRDLSVHQVRNTVQFVFQDPFGSLNNKMKIGVMLDSVLRRHQSHLTRAQRWNRISELLEEVGLTVEDTNKYPRAFSGGQRQRLGIARALAAEPQILICDESVSALDVSVQAQVLNLLNNIKKKRGLSMLFISHDPDVIRYMCDRILSLSPLSS